MRFYQTEHSNQVHQLLITPSRHLHVLKDGRLKYQKSKIDPRLSRTPESAKDQVIHCIIRDHYSQTMYAEIHLPTEIIRPESFLWQAWSQKADSPFCGLPDAVMLPKSLAYLASSLDKLGISSFQPTGGFMAGVRTFRDWEQCLMFSYNCYNFPDGPMGSFRELQSKAAEINRTLFDQTSNRQSKLARWKSGLRELKLPPPHDDFIACFNSVRHGE